MLNMAGIDMAAGRWDADFYLYFTSEGSSYYTLVPEQGESYFPNGYRGLQMNSVSKLPHIVNVTSQYRVKGSFYFDVNAYSYPFESHKLEVVFEDPRRTRDEVVLEPDYKYTGLSSNIKFPGFSPSDIQASMEIETFVYPPFDEGAREFTRMKYVLEVNRPRLNSFIKGLLPPLLILVVVCFNSFLPLQHLAQRINVNGSMLVAAVLYHSSLANQAPSTGRLSVADAFMLVTYALITLNFSTCIWMLKLQADGRESLAQEIHSYLEVVQLVCTPFSLTALSIRWNALLLMVGLATGLCLLRFCLISTVCRERNNRSRRDAFQRIDSSRKLSRSVELELAMDPGH